MPFLQSHLIEAVAYNEARRLLHARFRKNGKTVTYEQVPQEVYDSLIFADSISDFFFRHIAGRYPVRSQ